MPHALTATNLAPSYTAPDGKEYRAGDVDHWNLWWRLGAPNSAYNRQLKPWQFTNHIPRGSQFCRKDNLARFLKCMKKVYGAIYDFTPEGYALPLDYLKLAAECSRCDSRTVLREGCDDSALHQAGSENSNAPVWICKPVGRSQGKGIFLFRHLSELSYDSSAVVQRYVQNPLLIGGYKFDLRLYVCVPSYRPPVVYLYREGLARFSTDKFTLNDLENPFRHLTNCSINKLGPKYAEWKERVGMGCKWTLRQLRMYLSQNGIRDWLLWQRISCLVALTILAQAAAVPQCSNCFEFFGFDVLVDEELRPWLLEVNISPGLGNDCDVDSTVKKPLLHEMFDLLGLPVCPTGLQALFQGAQYNQSQE
ncbi:probable tubulin polyglutamylase TTLL2 [Ctenocephalides felis]|uniref:probable tubulin polyglutamylase TTLL2 n=1 Tax=Ctenocephalides felis TaxID=7515 RepID=UPI000E6E3A56|nr:probable tubulin polyglutamylase TTLL2 [Ctenocephalides felis]